VVRQIKKTKTRKREKTKKIEQTTFLQKVFYFFQENARTFIYAISIILIIGVAAGIFLYTKKQSERNAAERFYQVLKIYWQSEEGKEEDMAKYLKAFREFQGIVNEYPGTRYAGWSLVYMGNCNLHLKNYKKAIESYDQYIKESKEADIFTADAYHGKGIAYIEEGKYPEAIKAYKDILKAGKGPLEEKLLWETGWCYEKIGDNKNALDFYKRIVKDHPASSFKSDAEKKVKVLEQVNQQNL